MRESDLTFRLENGVAIWGPLWKHEKPLITPFTCEVIAKETNPQDDIRKGQSNTTDQSTDSDPEFSPATFFDVAVLKCLSSTGWDENGIMWALRYLAAYLKREFNLPDQAISREASGEFRGDIPVHGSPVVTVHPDISAVQSDVQAESITKPDGTEVVKIKDRDAQNGGSDGLSEANKLSTYTCQTEDDTNSNMTNDQGSIVTKSVHLAVPQSTTTSPSNESQSDNCDTLKIPKGSDGERPTAQGLERTGSIKLRIRVQSSPGGAAGGRVLTAVASPTGSMTPQQEVNNTNNDDSQDFGETGTFQSTKVYIKPSNSLQVPSVSTGDANTQNSGGPLLGKLNASHLQNGNLNNVTTNVSTESSTKETSLQISLVESSHSMFPKPDEQASAVPQCTDPAKIHTSGESNNPPLPFESMVSYECEVHDSQSGKLQTENGVTGDQLKDASLSKRLSEHTNSSHASSSSVESESQPLLKPSPFAIPNRKALTLLGLFESPRTNVNRDSFTKIDRYFVFPGVADYITTDGRLSSLMILQALYNIMRENPTSLISDATLTILQQLVTIHENMKSKKRGSSLEVDDRTVAETQSMGFRSPHSDNILGRLRASFYGRPPSFLSLSMGCLVSLIKALGCPLGKSMPCLLMLY